MQDAEAVLWSINFNEDWTPPESESASRDLPYEAMSTSSVALQTALSQIYFQSDMFAISSYIWPSQSPFGSVGFKAEDVGRCVAQGVFAPSHSGAAGFLAEYCSTLKGASITSLLLENTEARHGEATEALHDL